MVWYIPQSEVLMYSIFSHIDDNHRRYIINDFKLPKIVADSPYFETQYYLLKEYGFEDTFKFVSEQIEEFEGNSDLFFDEVNKLSSQLFNYIIELYTNDYIKQIRDTLNTDQFHNIHTTYRNTLANDDAINQSYIRIDINKACFNVLRQLTSKLDAHASYDELVHSFTWFDEPVRNYVANAKRIRSYVFGGIQKQLIIHLEKHIISEIIERLGIQDYVFKDCDELVLPYSKENNVLVDNVLATYKLGKILRKEIFTLKKVDHGYIEDYNGTIVFKGIPADMFCEQYARYYGETMLNDYKVFNHQRIPCMRLL